MSKQDDGFQVEKIIGRGRDFASKIAGMQGRKYPCGTQLIVFGEDVAEKLKLKAGSRLALAQLANGMHAIVPSPCGWKVQQFPNGASFFIVVRRGVKFLKDAEAYIERGMYVFPAGTFSESRNVDRLFK